MIKNINYWYLSSFLVSLLVALPVLTVFTSFFGTTSGYDTFEPV
jgi:iron(III) transport system permease protein